MRFHKIFIPFFIAFLLLVTLGTFSLCAEGELTKGKPTLPGETCQTEPLGRWTRQEKWVWKQVCEGKIADFNESDDYGGKLDPRKSEEWPESRILTQKFLETILLHEPYRGALAHHGVRIVGAWFREPIDLSSAILNHQLWLDSSCFDKDVELAGLKTDYLISLESSKFNGLLDMRFMEVGSGLNMSGGTEFKEVIIFGARIVGQIYMNGSKFTGKLDMDNMELGSNLYMSDGAEFKEVNLIEAKIGGQIAMNGSKFTGKLNMSSIEVKSNLFMSDRAEFKEVDILGAKIGGQIAMNGSKFTGKLNMDNMEVGSLQMRDGTEFKEVILRGAKVGKQITMNGSKFNGLLNMDSIVVGSSLIMSDGAEFNEVDLMGAKIGKLINLSGSTFNSIDLLETNVHKEFILDSSYSGTVKWNNNSRMILRNTQIGTLQDSRNSWPENLELNGFTYDRLGKFFTDEVNDTATRDITWLKEWLNKQKRYSPQPYEHLASILQESGRNSMANSILYTGRERKRNEMATGLYWTYLTILEYGIGYGYGYRIFRAIFWAFVLVILGTIVLRVSRQYCKKDHNHKDLKCWGLAYSIDMLLPIIHLRKYHYDKIELEGGVRVYFYIHKILGYALALFIITGLSGIVK